MVAGKMGGCGSRGDERVWEHGRWEGVGAGKIGGCGSRGDERMWGQGKWKGVGAGGDVRV